MIIQELTVLTVYQEHTIQVSMYRIAVSVNIILKNQKLMYKQLQAD